MTAKDDDGLSLIELIVVVVLVGILSGVIVMVLVNSWNTQEDVQSTTTATNEGQVYASSIERAVRNAEAVQVTGGSLLQVRTTLGGTRACQAFRMTSSATVGDAAYLTAAAAAPTWPGPWITEKVTTVSTATPYFDFDEATGVVTYAFQIDTTASPVVFQGNVATRNDVSTGVMSPC